VFKKNRNKNAENSSKPMNYLWGPAAKPAQNGRGVCPMALVHDQPVKHEMVVISSFQYGRRPQLRILTTGQGPGRRKIKLQMQFSPCPGK
jgi:hypothetical protein